MQGDVMCLWIRGRGWFRLSDRVGLYRRSFRRILRTWTSDAQRAIPLIRATTIHLWLGHPYLLGFR